MTGTRTAEVPFGVILASERSRPASGDRGGVLAVIRPLGYFDRDAIEGSEVNQ